MPKCKYRTVLDTLRNIKPNDNINHQTISNYLGGNPSANALANRYHNDGYMQMDELQIISNVFNYNFLSNTFKEKSNSNDYVDLPVRGNLSASMGAGVEIIDETQTGTYSVSKKLMKDVGANQQYTDFIPCEGDSMYPTIEGGALLMVDRSKTEIFDGKIYCIRLNNNLIAKRLQFIPPNSVKVISDNKEKYDAFYVDLSKQLDYDFAIIGEVKWYGTIVR